MSKTNIPAGGCPVTKTEAAGMPFGLRGGAEEPKQKPAAWAGKEGKASAKSTSPPGAAL